MTTDSLLWQVRAYVYQHFADTIHPPSVEEAARHFNISVEGASALYKDLNDHHALFLAPGTLNVLMAWPFSAAPTNFRVHVNDKTYFANCAWDMLGIPAALHSDAVIEALCTESNDSIQLEIKDGQIVIDRPNNVTLSDSEGFLPRKNETLRSQQPLPHTAPASLPESDMLLVHFPLRFSRWYDDLVFT